MCIHIHRCYIPLNLSLCGLSTLGMQSTGAVSISSCELAHSALYNPKVGGEGRFQMLPQHPCLHSSQMFTKNTAVGTAQERVFKLQNDRLAERMKAADKTRHFDHVAGHAENSQRKMWHPSKSHMI